MFTLEQVLMSYVYTSYAPKTARNHRTSCRRQPTPSVYSCPPENAVGTVAGSTRPGAASMKLLYLRCDPSSGA